MEKLEKYTQKIFKTQRELDIFRATPEYKLAQGKWVTDWLKKYECTLCEATFSTYIELQNHYFNVHEDKIAEAVSQVTQKKLIKIKR